MPLTFNGNAPENITYNGNEVSKVTWNGDVVWEAVKTYTITYHLTNCTAYGTIPTTITEGQSVSINTLANSGYYAPYVPDNVNNEYITITNASKSSVYSDEYFAMSTTLTNPTGNVDVYINYPAEIDIVLNVTNGTYAPLGEYEYRLTPQAYGTHVYNVKIFLITPNSGYGNPTTFTMNAPDGITGSLTSSQRMNISYENGASLMSTTSGRTVDVAITCPSASPPTYLFNNTSLVTTGSGSVNYNISYKYDTGTTTYTNMNVIFGPTKVSAIYYGQSPYGVSVYGLLFGWTNQIYRRVIFETEPTGDLLTFLNANATRLN